MVLYTSTHTHTHTHTHIHTHTHTHIHTHSHTHTHTHTYTHTHAHTHSYLHTHTHTHTHAHTHMQVVYQSIGFTQLWLTLKSILCPVNLLVLLWFLRRVAAAASTGLIEKCVTPLLHHGTCALHHHYVINLPPHRSLAFLGTCLALYNGEF